MKILSRFLPLFLGLFLLPFVGRSANSSPASRLAEANRQHDNGNWKDALQIYQALFNEADFGGKELEEAFGKAVEAQQRLNQITGFDALAEAAIKVHPKDWRLLRAAGNAYFNTTHWGIIIENKFQRAAQGTGRPVSSEDRDRVRGLQLLEQALLTVTAKDADVGAADKAGLLRDFQGILTARQSWELQALTDLKTLPDYDEQPRYYYGQRSRYHGAVNGPSDRGAPVDEKGDPVFFHVPESWDAAKSDGERWRWILKQWSSCGERAEAQSDLVFGEFLRAEFDVRTIAQWWRPSNDEDAPARENSLLTLHTLKENETIARLATGVKRFTLPEEFNFITILERVGAKSQFQEFAWEALNGLAETFQDRRQLPRAAEIWRQALTLRYNQEVAQAALDQIIKNWGRFDNSLVQTSGQGAKVGFVFRNGTKVKFTARKIKFQQLLTDTKKYIASDPENLDWERTNFQQIGYSILEDHFAKYIGEKVAQWDLDLQPQANHWDRRVEVTTPLQTAGAYFLEADITGGNKTGIVVWLSDTAIVKKEGQNEVQYYVADAVSGAPVPHATLEFFGYTQQWLPSDQRNGRRNAHIISRDFAETTDAQGQFFSKAGDVSQNYQWLITATTKEGRFAHLGWTGVWYNSQRPEFYEQTKVYTITDRPVYRPGQPMKFKAWVRRANYDAPLDRSEFAHEKFSVQIHDAKGEKMYDKMLETDEFGGLKDELTLKEDAALGVYRFEIRQGGPSGSFYTQQGTFRVEEYKKPEFEVKVDAPSEPVALGEKLKAKVTAKYYFGAPVVNAKVKYKVQRSAYTARWYPVREWDWFYGPGYWWFGYDYFWYPGFTHWGCRAPVWWWWNTQPDPPELVSENEAPIGPDGTVEIPIDTSLAKELHPDEDHRYEISVEVTDESRRTILGSGSVLVAREPFKVYVWTDRGHYEVNRPIEVGIKAQTLDHKGVKGKTKVSLLKVSYDGKGEPKEKEVITQDISTNDEGGANVKFNAAEPGQYRVSTKVTDAKGRTMEGGYVFTVRGKAGDGKDFRFNDLELVTEKAEYEAGETLKLLVNTEHADSTVYLFVRSQGQVVPHPQVLTLQGKSSMQEIKVETGDMPNFFIEAFTVSNGQVHTAVREIAVPPSKRVLNLEVLADNAKHKPHEKAKVKLKLTDLEGKPYVGSTVVTVYDKALEYISGGSNVPDIKEYFWKWRRHFYASTENNLMMQFPGLNVPRDATGMSALGVFGFQTVEVDAVTRSAGKELTLDGFSGGIAGRGTVSQGAAPMPMSAAAPAPPGAGRAFAKHAAMKDEADKDVGQAGEPQGGEPAAAQVMVRSEFTDSVYWTASLDTNAEGIAEIEVPLPDNLTTWKIRSWAMGHGTRVGEGETEIITSKDLILRQQAPRFFVEKDEVTLSANVHNYLPDKKDVKVVLELGGSCLEAMPGQELTQTISLGSKEEHRVDWRVKAVREGTAVVRMKALTDGDSDAMEMKYPVFVHGMLKTDSFSGAVRPEETAGKITITVPNERRPEQSRLEVRYSPTIATAIVDAIPYLVDYPYGCTEQTLNRFLPAVLAHRTLTDMGVDLAAIEKKRTNLNPQEIGNDQERAKQWKRYLKNPVFDDAEYRRIVKQGVEKLTAMQNRDGGWGWFSGDREESYAHTTSVVVHGLIAARQAGVTIIPGVVEHGLEWLKNYEREQVRMIQNFPNNPSKQKADNLDAFVFFVLAEGDSLNKEMRDFLYRDRNDLAVYGKCVYALGLDMRGEKEKRDMLWQNIEQYLVLDAENQTARLDVRNGGFWWWWYGSEIETQAFYLKLLSRIDPKSEKASGLVKFLINNRKNSTWWNSTRDTAYCVEALNDYLKATKEAEPNVTVEVLLDGEKKKEVQISKENLFSYDNALIIEGAAVPAGKHTVEVRKKGNSPIYFNAYVTNFTLEDPIKKAGLEVKIERRYYKLTERKDTKALVSGSRGQALQQNVLKYDRTPIKDGEEIKSGDLIEVELVIESKNDYEYLLFEDMKPAGFEADDVRSGYDYSTGMAVYREFHDERVSLFARALPLGKHSLTYRLRAEIPGKFSALPAKAHAMYAPELRGNSDEFKIGVAD